MTWFRTGMADGSKVSLDLLKDTVGFTGKNQAFSQANNAVIAHIENGKAYKVSWTGSATVTLKKDSSSGTQVATGSTSPLTFTADSAFDLYFGSSADVTSIMVYDASISDDTYEANHASVETLLNSVIAITNPMRDAGVSYHNIPRNVPKDITQYVTDGTLYKRLNGTDGFSKYEDLYVGDYIKMSRAISAKNKDTTQQATGSQYVTIAGISCMRYNGNTSLDYEHLVMVPGQGFGGTQHFGKSRMNSSNVTTGGYVGSELFTDILGAVTNTGSTADGATINQQLYAEFGSHLKTTKEWISNAINATGYNKFGTNTGCASANAWTSVQAILMSEMEVYGGTVFGSSGFDSGMNPYQFPLFNHSKIATNNRSAWYWLRDVATGSHFCDCNSYGLANYHGASTSYNDVRPRFVIA